MDVVCYDLNPGTALLTNGWHGDDLYAEICAKDCTEAVAHNPDRTAIPFVAAPCPTRMMANQCRAAIRPARPPEGLVSGVSEDLTRTVVAAAWRHGRFVGAYKVRRLGPVSPLCPQTTN